MYLSILSEKKLDFALECLCAVISFCSFIIVVAHVEVGNSEVGTVRDSLGTVCSLSLSSGFLPSPYSHAFLLCPSYGVQTGAVWRALMLGFGTEFVMELVRIRRHNII